MEFTLVFGEKRIGQLQSVRTYFLAVSPTGTRMSVKDSPNTKIKYTKRNATEREGREFSYTYTVVRKPLILEMTTSETSWGNPLSKKTALITVDDTAEELEVSGSKGFGSFKGRARIDIPKDQKPDRDKRNIREAEIVVRVLKPATTEDDSSKGHTLIW